MGFGLDDLFKKVWRRGKSPATQAPSDAMRSQPQAVNETGAEEASVPISDADLESVRRMLWALELEEGFAKIAKEPKNDSGTRLRGSRRNSLGLDRANSRRDEPDDGHEEKVPVRGGR
jgi:hypothetical protein